MPNYFIIDTKLPSLNEYQNECRTNKYKGAKFKKEIEETIELFIYKYKRKKLLIPPTRFPITINIEWHEKDLKRDVDNIKSAAKFILDAMQETKIIPNDNRKHIAQIHDVIIKEPTKKTFVVVKITEPEEQ